MGALLSVKNTIIGVILNESIKESYISKKDVPPIATTFCDFDRVSYSLHAEYNQASKKAPISISISAPCLSQLCSKFSLDQELKRFYPDASTLVANPKSVLLNFEVDLVNIDDPSVSEFIDRLSLLKRNLFAIPFYHAIQVQEGAQNSETFSFIYRPDEFMFIKPYADRIVVVFQLRFKSHDDTVFARIFIQEFVDARKLPHLQNSPQIIFSKEPPAELAGIDMVPQSSSPGQYVSDQNGFISIILFPRHFAPGERREQFVSMIQTFRNYFHYRIKALKIAIHTRERARVTDFTQVLNRAKLAPVEKKLTTIKGKTFTRSEY